MKIAVILSRIPYPLEKGDKLRAYHQLLDLSKKHDIHLYCVSDTPATEEAIERLKAICKTVHVYHLKKWKIAWRLFIALFRSTPFQIHYFFDKQIRQKIHSEIRSLQPDHIYAQLIRTAEYVKDLHGFDKTLDYMDAFSQGMNRRIETSKGIKKLFIRTESKRLLQYENRIFDYFEKKCIISAQDREHILHKDRAEIQIIPNGVDTDYFQPEEHSPEYELLFHGNLSYAPNVTCVEYLAQEFMPALRKKAPKARLLITGASVSNRVRAVCKDQPGIELKGFVEDVRSSYRNARMLIAPFSIGTGLQNKLLESMAMGLPCVTSELCFNAIASAVKDQHMLVGSSTEEYVDLCLRLLNDTELGKRLSVNGRQLVVEHFSWQAMNAELEKLICS